MDPKPGYWTERRLNIWRRMTPTARDYDRYQGVFPPGDGLCETEAGRAAVLQRDDPDHVYEPVCSCHISAPCAACTNAPEEN